MSDLLTSFNEQSLKPALEALLLVSVDPVSAVQLAKFVNAAPGDVAAALAELSEEYDAGDRGIVLREVAGGWRLYTHPAYAELIEQYVLSWDTRKLSQAALETLAVIAYHQPVTRDAVRAVRGVNSDGVITSLVDKGLVREVGRMKEHGQAILYGTTQAFLEKFGLRSLDDLPDLEEFAPDEESRAYIRERLSTRPVVQLEDEDAPDENQMTLSFDETATNDVILSEADEGAPHDVILSEADEGASHDVILSGDDGPSSVILSGAPEGRGVEGSPTQQPEYPDDEGDFVDIGEDELPDFDDDDEDEDSDPDVILSEGDEVAEVEGSPKAPKAQDDDDSESPDTALSGILDDVFGDDDDDIW